MYTYTRSRLIAAPPRQCFNFLTDPAKMPAWDPNVSESKLVSDGPMTVGSKLQQVRKQGNRQIICGADVIEHEPFSRHAVRTSMMGVQAIFTYRFEAQGNSTRMTAHAELQGKGIARLLENFMGKMCEKVDSDILDRIASAMNEEASALRV